MFSNKFRQLQGTFTFFKMHPKHGFCKPPIRILPEWSPRAEQHAIPFRCEESPARAVLSVGHINGGDGCRCTLSIHFSYHHGPVTLLPFSKGSIACCLLTARWAQSCTIAWCMFLTISTCGGHSCMEGTVFTATAPICLYFCCTVAPKKKWGLVYFLQSGHNPL